MSAEKAAIAIKAYEIADFSDKAEQLAKMALALEVAMFSSDFDPKEYEPAVTLLTGLMFDHVKGMKELSRRAADAEKTT